MKLVFLDTNIFIHYQPINQIDWSGIFKEDKIKIIITTTVISELDQMKDSSNAQRKRERARKALNLIEKICAKENLRGNLNKNVILEVEAKEPSITWEEEGLDPDTSDDRIIASIMKFSEKNPILVTNDTGIKLKAKYRNFTTKDLPDKYKLEKTLTAKEKKIKQLEKEVQKYRDASPLLKLRLVVGQDESKIYKAKISEPPTEDEIEKSIEKELPKIKEEYPPIESTEDMDIIMENFLGFSNSIPVEEFERYDKSRKEYFQKYQEYLEKSKRYEILCSRTVEAEFLLINEGTMPANNIDIGLFIPHNNVKIFRTEEFPAEPTPPKPPNKPRTSAELLKSRINNMVNSQMAFPQSYINNTIDKIDIADSNISPFEIEEGNSYSVQFKVECIKQSTELYTKPLYFIIPIYEEPSVIEINCEIRAENAVGVKEDTLKILPQYN